MKISQIQKKQWLGFVAIDVLFSTDILLKYVVQQNETLRYTINDNAAFSLPLNQNFIIVVSFFIILYLIRLCFISYRSDHMLHALLYLSIILGAVSNFIDRVLYGGVIDYLLLTNYFPIFNLSDILISVGLGGFLLLHVLHVRPPKNA